MKLLVNNNKIKIDGPAKLELALYNDFAIRHPNAFHLRAYMPKGWDGKIRYLTEAGYISTGLLPDLIEKILKKSPNEKITIEYASKQLEDARYRIPKEINGWVARGYQKEAIESIVLREIQGEPFPRGIIKAATNAGKNLIIAYLYKTFNVPMILIFNRKELYDTAMEEIPKILGKDAVGFINAKEERWKPFMICMAQTLSKRIAKHKKQLATFEACVVDECDLSDNKTYKGIISNLFNTYIRVGLSGSYSASPLAKYRIRDTNIKSFFSGIVYTIKNTELQEMGYSSDVIIKFHQGNTDVIETNYRIEYEYGIVRNKKRNRLIRDRVKYYVKIKKTPVLVVAKEHRHIKKLYKLIIKKFPEKRVEMVHHKTSNRQEIIKAFADGEIDILIGSMIVSRGKNFPKMGAMINAGGGDSSANALQLFGRITRKDQEQDYKFYEDFMDAGNYLKRHSKHRLFTFKRDNLEVIELYKL